MEPATDPIAVAQDHFSANVDAVLRARGMKRVDLARKAGGNGGPSSKTVYNILNRAHPPNLKKWGALAAALKIPLWVLLIPGLAEYDELLTTAGLHRLEKLLSDYLASDPEKRRETEEVASAGAITKRLKR